MGCPASYTAEMVWLWFCLLEDTEVLSDEGTELTMVYKLPGGFGKLWAAICIFFPVPNQVKLSCQHRKQCDNVPSCWVNIAHSTENDNSMLGSNRWLLGTRSHYYLGQMPVSKRFNLVIVDNFTKFTKLKRLRFTVYQTRRINPATTPTGKGDYQNTHTHTSLCRTTFQAYWVFSHLYPCVIIAMCIGLAFSLFTLAIFFFALFYHLLTVLNPLFLFLFPCLYFTWREGLKVYLWKQKLSRCS